MILDVRVCVGCDTVRLREFDRGILQRCFWLSRIPFVGVCLDIGVWYGGPLRLVYDALSYFSCSIGFRVDAPALQHLVAQTQHPSRLMSLQTSAFAFRHLGRGRLVGGWFPVALPPVENPQTSKWRKDLDFRFTSQHLRGGPLYAENYNDRGCYYPINTLERKKGNTALRKLPVENGGWEDIGLGFEGRCLIAGHTLWEFLRKLDSLSWLVCRESFLLDSCTPTHLCMNLFCLAYAGKMETW